MRTWIIHNSRAGNPAWGIRVKQLGAALARRGHPIRVEQTHDLVRLRYLVREAIVEGAEAIWAAGGDGTVNAIAAELSGTPIALGVVPIGTANLWAKQLGLIPPCPWSAEALEEIAQQLLLGQARTIDLGYCNGHPFITYAGIGFDAFVIRRVGTRGWLARQVGMLYFLLVALRYGHQWRGMEMQIMTDTGQKLEGRHLLAVATSIPRFGGGLLTLSPHSRLDDGLLDVWVFEGCTPWETFRHIRRLARGEHLRSPHVHHLVGARIEIHTPASPEVHADGEMLALSAPIILTVRRQSLRVLFPPGVPASLFASVAIMPTSSRHTGRTL